MKLKNMISFLLIGIAFLSCKKNNNDMINQKIYYAINYDTNIPYEIYVNGISIARSYQLKGQEGGYRILNPFIEKSGMQNISIKLFIKDSSNLTNDFLAKQKFELYTFDDIENPEKIELIKKIDIDKESIKQLFLMVNFEAKIPYNLSNSINNFSDLTKQDSIKLLEECKVFYMQIAKDINEGNDNKYKEVIKNSIDREFTSLYYTEEQKLDFLSKTSKRVFDSKGLLQPLENFSLKIHPNKKIVSLVDKKGNTPLIFSKDKKENRFSFLLYKKNGSESLEVY